MIEPDTANRRYMVFDVESVGLHGEGFAFGFIVVDENGAELRTGYDACPPETAEGSDESRRWIGENLPYLPPTCASPREVRARFWKAWEEERAKGAVLVAENGWPVEARFLAACIDDDPTERIPGGPFPLHEVSTALLATGQDPMAEYDRKLDELPRHHPVADARQSARLFTECLAMESSPW
jgi:hypothetical protein